MNAKYDKIGEGYNQTRKADNFLFSRLLHHLNPEPNLNYLEIGCGTGNYTNQFQKRGFNFIGIDPSEEMLEKARDLNSNIDWKLGLAENTGLDSGSIDGIFAFLTIHHWTDLVKGFQELNRVLKPSGEIIIFTSTPKQMKGYWLNHYFPKMMEDSIIQMPSLKGISKGLRNTKFKIIKIEPYSIQADLQDQFLYCGKEQPRLYFEKEIRNGISSFSSLSNKIEVEIGLSRLRNDLEKNKFNQIANSFINDLGDYLFIIAKKQ